MKKNLPLIALFALILALPALDSVFHFSPVKDLFEKRLPIEKPRLPKNFNEAQEYPKNFEKFFNDNYGFRKSLVSANSHLMDKIFDESPDARALIGLDGWLYFDNHNSLLDAVGRAKISDELVVRGVKAFGENWKKMRGKNINYLLVIAADKSTIYPEFLPSYMKPSKPHRIDKFLSALKKEYPDFPVLDLRPILKKAKEKEIVYHKTDTHWNRRGGHYAYVEIAKILKFKPHLREDFIDKSDGEIMGDISDIMNSAATNVDYSLTPKFKINSYHKANLSKEFEAFHKPAFFVNNDRALPTIFVYKDSYFGELFELMSEHFSESLFVNEFPCNLNEEIIKKFPSKHGPNVVIQEFWEGRIEVVLNQCQTR